MEVAAKKDDEMTSLFADMVSEGWREGMTGQLERAVAGRGLLGDEKAVIPEDYRCRGTLDSRDAAQGAVG